MNSLQLRYALLKLTKNIDTGVYAADQLNAVTKKHFAIIVNIDVSSGEGIHWVTFVRKYRQKHLHFFDSLGLP